MREYVIPRRARRDRNAQAQAPPFADVLADSGHDVECQELWLSLLTALEDAVASNGARVRIRGARLELEQLREIGAAGFLSPSMRNRTRIGSSPKTARCASIAWIRSSKVPFVVVDPARVHRAVRGAGSYGGVFQSASGTAGCTSAVTFAVCPATFRHDERVPEAADAWTRAVRRVVKRIPRGRVATYGLVGVVAGRPLAARAVGNVMRACDDSDVPCHRVVRSDGLPAFAAHASRLRREGVGFLGPRVDIARHLWTPRLPQRHTRRPSL
ncbi:MAG: MGMT family protein [Chloroflexota bacterium]|nr:MGMT family protein [Chloroflexota bacterium]